MIVERATAAPLSENEYYIEDLKKLDVVNQFGKKIGKVVDVMGTGRVCFCFPNRFRGRWRL